MWLIRPCLDVSPFADLNLGPISNNLISMDEKHRSFNQVRGDSPLSLSASRETLQLMLNHAQVRS